MKYTIVRADGRLERICEHGCGHTVGHWRGHLKEGESIHGCDGCCKEYETQETILDEDSETENPSA